MPFESEELNLVQQTFGSKYVQTTTSNLIRVRNLSWQIETESFCVNRCTLKRLTHESAMQTGDILKTFLFL